MLQNQLYTISSKEIENNSAKYTITQNKENVIFKAHFPGNPITPGACLIEIGKELCEDFFEKKLLVKTIKSVKFMNLITPTHDETILYSIDFNQLEESIQAKIVISAHDVICSKINMELA